MSVDLAPHSKQGLALTTPLIAGSGAAGFADAWPAAVDPDLFGAVVTAPITLNARKGSPQPRLAELPGGFLLDTGEQNPGYRRVIERCGPVWQRLGLPVILAFAAAPTDEWVELAVRSEEVIPVAGIELHVTGDSSARSAATAVAAVRRATTLPLLVKLPAATAEILAEPAAKSGADALVVGTPPGAAYPSAGGQLVEAPVSGPVAFPFTLRALRAVAALRLDLPIVAAGGIHSTDHVSHCLDMGASAVQIRSLLWIDPAAAVRLATTLRSSGS